MPPRNRELRVVISGDPSQLNRAFAKAGVAASQFEGRIGKASAGIGRGLTTAAKIGTAALGVGLVGALKGSIDAFAEAERVGAQTNAVLKSTGGAANLSAKQVGALATAISKKSGMDDEAIQSGENLLLTFTKIRNEQGKGNDIFSQATSIMADMSTALGQDTRNSALQLGKALNDPVRGVTALRRVGVSFTKDQQEQIKTLVASGKTMDAQRLILKELHTEFGGSAEAAGNTFSGSIDKAKVAVGNLGEAVGGTVAPIIAGFADKLAGVADALASSDRPAQFFGSIKDFAGDAKDAVDGLFHTFDALKSTRGSTGAAIGTMLADAFANIDWSAIGTQISTGLSSAMNLGSDVSSEVEAGLQAAFSNVDGRKVLGGLLDTIGEALDALFSPSFWIEHFSAIFSLVTIVIPVGRLLRIPGFATLFRFISGPIFRAVGAVGSGLVRLLGAAGSRAFTAFLAEIERAFPRIANAMLSVATGGANALRSFPGRVAAWGSRTVSALADRLGDAVGRVAGIMGRAVGGGVARLGNGVAAFAGAAGRLVRAILGRLDNLAGNVPSSIARALAAGTARMAAWVGNFASAAVKLGRGLVDGIVRGVRSTIGKVASAITGGIGSVASKLNPFGEGIGKEVGQSSAVPSGGGGSLHGANRIMAPFAGMAARLGLTTTAGRDDHSRMTSSGNVSWHASGNAIDEAGPFPAMHRYAQTLYSRFGGRLRELISPWAELGIKDGQPFRYSGRILAQHSGANAHVHVAYTGDGIGRTGDGTGSNLTTIAQYLRGRGFTAAQTAGILGNLRQESGFNPAAVEGGGKGPGIGIAQWSYGRASALKAFARRQGKPWTDLGTQLAFMMSEFRGSESRAFRGIRAARSVGAAETAFGRLYERYGKMGDRSGGQYLALARRAGSSGGGGTSDNGAASSASSIDASIQHNKDRIDALRGQLRHLGSGKKTAGQRTALQDEIAQLNQRNRHLAAQKRALPDADTTSSYELAIAGSDVAIAEAQQGGTRRGVGGRIVSSAALRETGAQQARMRIVNARIARVRAGLRRRGIRPATQLRLRQELAQLLGERTTITGRITELGTLPESTATGEPAEPATPEDYVRAAMAQAALTPDTEDDLAQANRYAGLKNLQYQEALASRDPRRIADTAEALKSAEDAIRSLQGSIEDEKKSREEHTAALNELAQQVRRQTDFAQAATSSTNHQAWKALADLLSGQLGARVNARNLTPGTGVAVAY